MKPRTLLLIVSLLLTTRTARSEGEPAPAPPAEPAIKPFVEVFAQYAFRRTNAQDGSTGWFHAFDVPRAFIGISAEKDSMRGRVLVEGVRSASEGALVGVAGDSVLARFREAWGGVRGFGFLDVRGGILPTWFVPVLDDATRMRVLLPSTLESSGFSAPADLGFAARGTLPLGYGEVGVAMYNGEGYTQRELNRGKNTEIAATLHPLASMKELTPLAITVGYVKGSAGTGSARADRVVSMLAWTGERIRASVAFAYAFGLQDDGSRRAWLLDAGARVEPIDRLLVAARLSNLAHDTTHPNDSLRTFLLGVGFRFDEGVEGWLSLLRSSPRALYRDANPASDFTEIRVSGRFAF